MTPYALRRTNPRLRRTTRLRFLDVPKTRFGLACGSRRGLPRRVMLDSEPKLSLLQTAKESLHGELQYRRLKLMRRFHVKLGPRILGDGGDGPA